MSENYGLFINGQWVPGASTLEVRAPYDGSLVATVGQADRAQVDAAISAAQAALPVMANLPAYQRAEILSRTANLLQRAEEDLALTIAREAGKAWKYALGEVRRSQETFQFAAEAAKAIHGETVPMDAATGGVGRMGFWVRVPIGVVVAISPFNFPLNLVAHKVAPAIAAGCPVVLKPASTTPVTALKLAELMQEAGLPPGALNVVVGGGSTVGNWLVEDPRVAKISFTGSPAVGKQITQRAGLKKLTMELGNNSGTILDADADLDAAIPRLLMGSFANSGQVCISVQRIYVHESREQEFTRKFVEGTRQLIVGDPTERETDVGPLIEQREAERIEQWVREAVAAGATVLTGGARQGSVMAPTVLGNVQPQMRVMCEEVFGPVVSIVPFNDFDQALELLDDSPFGLQAGVYTNDLRKAMRAVQRLNVGGVIINDVPTFRADHMPYGGVRESGLGREGPRFAIEEMTTIKMVVWQVS
jgi:acyl-CoA reductase-like NAD-dependent aldehyde dehydrogenase